MAMETMIKVKMMMVLHQHKDEDDDDDEGINGGGRLGHPSPGLPNSGSNLPQAEIEVSRKPPPKQTHLRLN